MSILYQKRAIDIKNILLCIGILVIVLRYTIFFEKQVSTSIVLNLVFYLYHTSVNYWYSLVFLFRLRIYSMQVRSATRIFLFYTSLSLTVSPSTPRILAFYPYKFHLHFYWLTSCQEFSYFYFTYPFLDYLVIIWSLKISKPSRSFSFIVLPIFDTHKLPLIYPFLILSNLVISHIHFNNPILATFIFILFFAA